MPVAREPGKWVGPEIRRGAVRPGKRDVVSGKIMVADLGSRANEAIRWKQVTSVEIRSTLSSSDGPLARLRFLCRVAHARNLGAARAALTILAAHGRIEVDPPDVGQSG